MNPSQKRSVAASSALHLSLVLLVVFAGSAFRSARPTAPELPPIDFIPTITTDTAQQGGGTRGAQPAVQPQVRPAPAPAVIPTPPPPRPAPAVVPPPAPHVDRTEPVAEPVKHNIRDDIPDVPKDQEEPPTARTKPNPDSLEPAPRPPRHKPNIDPQITTRDDTAEIERANRRSEAERAAKRRRDYERQEQQFEEQAREVERQAQREAQERRDLVRGLAGDVRRLSEGIPTSGTAVHLEGPGGDGVPYANFLQGVQARYERDWRPRVPRGATDMEISAWATVTIGRNGDVLEARLKRSSGNHEVDESVNATLNSVREVPPLPEAAKESQRTITIEFNVKPKKSLG